MITNNTYLRFFCAFCADIKRRKTMPKNLFQEIIFTAIMVIFMVYVMICYNIAVNVWTTDADGVLRLTNDIFVEAFEEWWYMVLIAFVMEIAVVGPIARKLTFRIIDPSKHAPIIVTWTMSGITVAFMCPIMSFFGTVIINRPEASLGFASWIRTTCLNFPMALCAQIFYIGPLVRLIFRAIFVYPAQRKQKKLLAAAAVAGGEVVADTAPADGDTAVEAPEDADGTGGDTGGRR